MSIPLKIILSEVLEAEILYGKIILGAQSESGVHFIPGLTVKQFEF